jgi:Tol biopolymer transport system component
MLPFPMSLAPGTRLGPYEVIAAIGAGGMGEVYRARDTKLGRDVALKILPESFTHDPERLARFRREAHVLAALNHPHIGAIYGLDEADGRQFLVLELVDGESLDRRIARGPIPVDDTLAIAKQIAEALEAAHEKGIVHRDLKPANVALTTNGNVKVLDFGLAKATEAAGSASIDLTNSPTITSPAMMTGVGMILGTAAYMSPEQAKGRLADKRSDVWAFGCVLFEMLSGRRAFEGDEITDVLAAVVKTEPDWSALPRETPWRVRDLLRRCLTKDAKQRVHDIADARIDLETALSEPATEAHGSAPAAGTHGRRWAVPAWWLLVTAMAGAGLVGVWSRHAVISPASPIRMVLDLPPDQKLAESDPAFSPDGRVLVYAAADASGRQQLFLRALDQLGATPLVPQPESVLYRPFFSPDGQWIGFCGETGLFKVPREGARQPQRVASGGSIRFGAWADDGAIVFIPDLGRGLLRVPAAGGTPETLATPNAAAGEMGYGYPEVLPGSRRILYALLTTQGWSLAALSLDTHEQKILVPGATIGRYVPSGHLVFAKEGGLLAVAFDADRLEITGTPIPILANLPSNRWAGGRQPHFAVSASGSLAYVAGQPDEGGRVALVDRKGTLTPLKDRSGQRPRFAPHGELVVVDSDAQIWVHDLARGGIRTRFTSGAPHYVPVWTPDGTRVAFSSYKSHTANLSWAPTSDPSDEEPLVKEGNRQYPTSFSPDGQWLAYTEFHPDTGADIWVVPLTGDRTPVAVVRTEFDEYQARFSPDGRWLAYTSERSGRPEVYVQGYPKAERAVRISSEGGSSPAWRGDGGELYYRNGNRIMAATVVAGRDARFGEPHALFDVPFASGVDNVASSFDVSEDGERFVVVVGEPPPPRQLHVIVNWVQELKAKTASR